MLEVGVVGCYHSEDMAADQLAQDSFRYRAADQRLGAGSHLVYQQQSAVVGVAQEMLHVSQVRRIGGQLVLDRLLVADVYHQLVKDPCPALLRHRHQETAL